MVRFRRHRRPSIASGACSRLDVRLFVAVELSTEMREVVLTTCDRLRHGLDRHVKARWTPAENLHVTVRFIGHVADADATR